MAAMIGAAAPLSETEHRTQLNHAVIASTVGTTIEWYDFVLYSTVTGLVFAKLYFPESDPLVGTLQAFAIYAVGFVARPAVGAAIFGHYGDRIGRKSDPDRDLDVLDLSAGSCVIYRDERVTWLYRDKRKKRTRTGDNRPLPDSLRPDRTANWHVGDWPRSGDDDHAQNIDLHCSTRRAFGDPNGRLQRD